MAPTYDQFTERFTEAYEMYEQDKLAECIAACQLLLKASSLPDYHRIKTLGLLGSTIGNRDEADSCCTEAREFWRRERRWQQSGKDPEADLAMEELDEWIQELHDVLDAEEE